MKLVVYWFTRLSLMSKAEEPSGRLLKRIGSLDFLEKHKQ
jgi:hypothetical protein